MWYRATTEEDATADSRYVLNVAVVAVVGVVGLAGTDGCLYSQTTAITGIAKYVPVLRFVFFVPPKVVQPPRCSRVPHLQQRRLAEAVGGVVWCVVRITCRTKSKRVSHIRYTR